MVKDMVLGCDFLTQLNFKIMATLKQFCQTTGVSFISHTQSGNGLNLLSANGQLVATVMTREETPEDSDEARFQWFKERANYNARISGNFLTLTAPAAATNITSLFEDVVKVKGKKVKA